MGIPWTTKKKKKNHTWSLGVPDRDGAVIPGLLVFPVSVMIYGPLQVAPMERIIFFALNAYHGVVSTQKYSKGRADRRP